MRPRDHDLAHRLEVALLAFDSDVRPLPGVRKQARRSAFVEQLAESLRRAQYVEIVSRRALSARRLDPCDNLFDPVKAAILRRRDGDVDEAFWLVFLSIHFGRNPRAGWRYARDVYGRLCRGARWDWASTSDNPQEFRQWLDENQNELRRNDGPRGFGNHRKYQSLDAYSPTGTGAAVESYVNWVSPPRTHGELLEQVTGGEGGPTEAFDALYRSMNPVASFGRTARFDYLTMLARIGLAQIEPPLAYLAGSTGPLRGARLLFGRQVGARVGPRIMDDWLVELDHYLRVGMDVMEDALCNWQKNPGRFVPFRG